MEQRHVLPQLLAERAKTHPDRIFIHEAGGESLTYAELHSRILRWSDAFRRHGVKEGDVVSVMLPNTPTTLLAWIGLAWLRATELPVNTSFIGKMLEDVLRTAASRLIVVDEQFAEQVINVAPLLPALETIVVIGAVPRAQPDGIEVVAVEQFLEDATPSEDTLLRAEPYDTACIVWTSGTTGPSKGTLLSWSQLLAMGTGAFPPEEMGEQDALYSPYPMYYVAGKLYVYVAAFVNARYVMRERFSTSNFWREIREYGCTYAPFSPATMRFLLTQPPTPEDADTPLHSVLVAPLPPESDDFCKRFGVRVRTAYNSTELSCPIVSEWNPENKRSCGRVRPGYQVRVVDEHDQQVAAGEIGELVVRADEPWKLMTEYFSRPDATVAAWRNLWFHTGDAFTYDEAGNYYFVDRIKDAIRRRGQNISSAEVEAAINEHPAVLECAVIAAPSEWGEDEVRAVLTLRGVFDISPEQIFQFCVQRLPHFMVPRYIDIVDELPKTPTEKIQKSELRRTGVTATTWDREAAGLSVKPGS